MLSRDCDGCSNMKQCNKRFNDIEVWEKVYCPDGTAHLVDGQQAKANSSQNQFFFHFLFC